MEDETITRRCQLEEVSDYASPPSLLEKLVYFFGRLRLFIRRRLDYLLHWIAESRQVEAQVQERLNQLQVEPLQAGDWVQVKAWEEVYPTLNRWNQYKGCGFMPEMRPYCGTKQRVLKRVERFLDERDYKMKNARGIVILESIHCPGVTELGRCDRGCYFFWREEWLQKLD
jgi:hypothetical protein